MKQVSFNNYYKGGRDYIHGTDIFNNIQDTVVELYGGQSFLRSLVIRDVARSQGALFFGSGDLPAGYKNTAQFIVQNGTETVKGRFAITNSDVTEHREYPEHQIIEDAKIVEESTTVTQISKSAFTSIEEIVAITKCLHNKLLKPTSGQWMFTMLNLDDSIANSDDKLFSVKLEQNLGGKMTRSSVFAGGKKIGTIGFTVL